MIASGAGGEAQSRSLAIHLAVFAAALLIPILVIAGALVARYALAERERYADIVRDGSRDLAATLDQELAGTGRVLRALALSDALTRGDLAAFHRQAAALGGRLGLRIVLGDAAGRPLLDSARDWSGDRGSELTDRPDPALAPGRPLDGAGALAVTDLIRGPAERDFRFAVVLDAERDGWRLAAERPVAQLQALLVRENLPEGATAAIFDRALTLAARLEDPEAYVGQPATPGFASGASAVSGVWSGIGKDGTEILAGYETSRLSGWRATVGLPRSVVAAPTRRSLAFIAFAVVATALACALAGSLFGGRIARPIAGLVVAAKEVGRGRRPSPVLARSGIGEVDAVADALADAAAERAARQARLVESEERLRLALEAGGLGSWDLDLVGGRRVLSPRSAAILGVDPSQYTERAAWTRFVHPDDQEPARAALAAAIEHGTPYGIEFRVRPPGGGERWVASQAIVLRDETGRASRVIGIHRDITRRRRMEEQLRASEQRLRATQEQASVGIAEVDADGRYLAVNEAFVAITGYPREGLIGRSLFSLSPPEDAHADRERFAELAAGSEPYALEKRFLRGDGTPGWIAVSASAVRDAHGRFLYGVRVVQDITARREAEESRALLVHELNHRVKNTLATVQSVAMQSFRDLADRDARDLFQNRLLALSKAHDVLTREDWRGAGLREVVAEALAPYRGEAGGEDTRDRFRVSGPAVRLAPRTALSIAMALHELATNAVKYGALSAETGQVALAWSVARPAGGRRLRLRWEEAGGPPVAPPTRRGFGSRLIERGLARELDGEVELAFAPTGVVCRIDAPLEGAPRTAAGRVAA